MIQFSFVLLYILFLETFKAQLYNYCLFESALRKVDPQYLIGSLRCECEEL